MPPARLFLDELELREDRGGFGGALTRVGAPLIGEPFPQLRVAVRSVEDALHDELRGDGSVPLICLELEGDVVLERTSLAVELCSLAEGDRGGAGALVGHREL